VVWLIRLEGVEEEGVDDVMGSVIEGTCVI
jgi:hypothetical protein